MNDQELTEVVRQCSSPFRKNMVRAVFIASNNMACTWHKYSDGNGNYGMVFSFPDYLEDAPSGVIRDITKQIIQKACYSSFHKYSQDTKKWLIMGMNKPEKIRNYCSRNGYTELELYHDALIVEHDGNVVVSSLFFRVIAVPRTLADEKERMAVIESEYARINNRIETFMEV